jgi:glycosyltransferase involved in cell wall biosynthesis
LSSRLEGGANVLSEAIVSSVPVLASHIPGSIGILGADYPGYFCVGNTQELTQLLRKAEADPSFLASLKARCQELAPLFDPEREKNTWKNLLSEL